MELQENKVVTDGEINQEFMERIRKQARQAMVELCELASLKKGQIVVIGCSTSEIRGQKIGSDSNEKTANCVFEEIYKVCKEKGLYLAAQCCEHLNRAIVLEQEAQPFADIVNVVPQPKAGGSFATAAYHSFENPIVVESIRADAGIDIGGTLIGMHLKQVAVPIRLETKKIGEANLIVARTRAKFIGGSRAIYKDSLL